MMIKFSRISDEQKKIVYISSVVLVFMLGFWIFIYMPEGRKLISIKNELAKTESQISEITSIVGGRELGQAVVELKNQFNELSGKFPGGEDQVISRLSELANALEIGVNSLVPSDNRPLEGKVGGYNIQEVDILMDMSCEYRKLGEFLNAVRNNFPLLVKIKELEIAGNGEGHSNLDIKVLFSAYVCEGK